jgi:hypothetical protein
MWGDNRHIYDPWITLSFKKFSLKMAPVEKAETYS